MFSSLSRCFAVLKKKGESNHGVMQPAIDRGQCKQLIRIILGVLLLKRYVLNKKLKIKKKTIEKTKVPYINNFIHDINLATGNYSVGR